MQERLAIIIVGKQNAGKNYHIKTFFVTPIIIKKSPSSKWVGVMVSLHLNT